MSILEVGTFNFEQEVLLNDQPVMVLVSSNNCEACRQFTKVFEQASLTHSKHFKFVILHSDRSPELAMDIADGNYPSTGVYRKGKLIMSMIGGQDITFYREFLNRQVADIKRRDYQETKSVS